MRSRDVKRLLLSVPAPDEAAARRRAWAVVKAAYESREPVRWHRRHLRPLAVLALAFALLAAIVTPPGRAVLNSIRDAIGRERTAGVKPAQRALFRLPAGGRVLVDSPGGAWIVHRDGSRRRLGNYSMAAWSAYGRYVGAVRGGELFAVDVRGNIRWTKARKQPVAFPRWSYEGYRIAYLSGRTIRIIVGNGTDDRSLGGADPRVAPAWRYGTHEVAYVGPDGSVRIADADLRRTLARAAAPPGGVRQLAWSADGSRLLAVGRRGVRVLSPRGRQLGAASAPGQTVAAAFAPSGHRFAVVVRRGRSAVVVANADGLRGRLPRQPAFSGLGRFDAVAWSPNGRWLLVSWPNADQWVFVRLGRRPKLQAVSNVSRQFDPGATTARPARMDGWCCP